MGSAGLFAFLREHLRLGEVVKKPVPHRHLKADRKTAFKAPPTPSRRSFALAISLTRPLHFYRDTITADEEDVGSLIVFQFCEAAHTMGSKPQPVAEILPIREYFAERFAGSQGENR